MIEYYNLFNCIYLDLKLFLSQTLDLLSPMAPLSFEPVAESGSSVFSEYSATLLGEPFVFFPVQVFFYFRLLIYPHLPAEEQPAERQQQDVPESTRSNLKM